MGVSRGGWGTTTSRSCRSPNTTPFAPIVTEDLTEGGAGREAEPNRRAQCGIRNEDRPSQQSLRVLLAKISGVTVPPKTRQVYQQFMHESYTTEIAPLVEERWRRDKSTNEDGSANTKKPDAAFRSLIAREVFDKLPAEEKVALKERALAHSKEAKDAYEAAMKNGPSKEPAARQKCIDEIGRFLAPILEGVQSYTGLQGVCVFGGPIPKNNGEIGTTHVAVGTNRAPMPVGFAGWNRPRFAREIVGFFSEYLHTAYSTQDCAEAALPSAVSLADAKYYFDENALKKSADSDLELSSDSDSDSSDSDSSGSDSEGAPKKKKRGKKGKEAQKRVSAGKRKRDESGIAGHAAKKLKKTRAGAEEGDDDDEEEEEDEAAKAARIDLDRRRANEREWADTRAQNKLLMEQLKIRQASEVVGLNAGKKGKPTPGARPAKNAAPAGPSRRSGRLSGGVDVDMPDADAMEVEVDEAERGDEDIATRPRPRARPTYRGTPGNPRIAGMLSPTATHSRPPPTATAKALCCSRPTAVDDAGRRRRPPLADVSTPIPSDPPLPSTTLEDIPSEPAAAVDDVAAENGVRAENVDSGRDALPDTQKKRPLRELLEMSNEERAESLRKCREEAEARGAAGLLPPRRPPAHATTSSAGGELDLNADSTPWSWPPPPPPRATPIALTVAIAPSRSQSRSQSPGALPPVTPSPPPRRPREP
ncbi:hypothetical protein DFH06DRAFT_1138681 [Mycena polygramma]|nr:hypothetical protein DFH06DRAFT_1138681 [Mycena polygramma]